MTPKQLLKAALALGILLLLWGATLLFKKTRADKPIGMRLPAIAATAVDTITISTPTDTIRLARLANGWTVNGNPASTPTVEEFFTALADTIEPSELVAENVASHQRLGVDSASGRRVVVRGGGQTKLDLFFGSHGPDFEGVYARRVGEVPVYLLHGDLPGTVDRRDEDWREKKIAAISPDTIARVEVTRGSRSYALTKGKTWTFAGGAPVDSGTVVRLLENFRSLSATGFPTKHEADSARFAKKARRIKLLDASGHPLLALAFDSGSAGFLVRADSGSTLYRMDTWVVDQLTPADSLLKPRKKTK
jgi:hypothetical protein